MREKPGLFTSSLHLFILSHSQCLGQKGNHSEIAFKIFFLMPLQKCPHEDTEEEYVTSHLGII